MEPDSRKECGYYGIKQPECEGKGCCWRPLENGSKAPWCFFPAKKGRNQVLISNIVINDLYLKFTLLQEINES